MLRLYNTALLPLRLGVAIRSVRLPHDPARRVEWDERRARRLPRAAPGGVWIHGASLGEVRIVRGLAAGLRARRGTLPLAVSATTATGRAQLPEPPAVNASFFVPLDFPGLATRVLGSLRPQALVLIETELWPNLIHECHDAGVPVIVLNGRLAPGRMRRYRWLSRLYRPLLERISLIGTQSEADARRLRELGAKPETVVVTGNIKYDLPAPATDASRRRAALGIAVDRPIFVAGSTAPGEERAVLEAVEIVRRERPDLLLVLAPRHLPRTDEVAGLIAASGRRAVRLSSGERVADADTVLVDTLGDLAGLYALATVAFVGGSLVPVGGHNVLEPAAAAVPVLFGPHTDHFAEPAEALARAGGGRRVANAEELARAIGDWLADPAARDEAGRRALALVESNRGALDRSISLLLEALDRHAARPGAT